MGKKERTRSRLKERKTSEIVLAAHSVAIVIALVVIVQEEEEKEEPSKPAFNPFDLLTDEDSPEVGKACGKGPIVCLELNNCSFSAQAGSEEDTDESNSDDDAPSAPSPPHTGARKPAGGKAATAATAKDKAKPQEEDIDAIIREKIMNRTERKKVRLVPRVPIKD